MELRGVEGYRRVYYYEYCAAKNGAIGDRPLEGDPIAAGTLITGGWIEIRAALAGDAALTLSLMRMGDIWQAAAGFSSLYGEDAIIPCPIWPDPPHCIRNRVQGALPILTIADAPLTGGRFVLALEGLG